MPELPEVETIVVGLKKAIGKRIIRVSASWPNVVIDGLNKTQRALKGKQILNISRRGKYIIYHLCDGKYLVQHLRMTGRMVLTKDKSPTRFERARITLSDNGFLVFDDQRKFGRLELMSKGGLERLNKKLGPEPLADTYHSEDLYTALKCTKRPIKAALLDQGLIAGLGNIYADESLFIAKIDPRTAADKITKTEAKQLWKAIRQILKLAISHRGTTFQAYRDAAGNQGEFFNKLAVYGRKGQQCKKCQAILQSVRLAQRQTVWCPRCQPHH